MYNVSIIRTRRHDVLQRRPNRETAHDEATSRCSSCPSVANSSELALSTNVVAYIFKQCLNTRHRTEPKEGARPTRSPVALDHSLPGILLATFRVEVSIDSILPPLCTKAVLHRL